MGINVFMLIAMVPGDPQDLNNYIEPMLWVPSIASLWFMKKWGAALTIAVLCITLGTSMWNVLLAYYTATMQLAFAPVNALRVVINAIATIYLFRLIFANKFS